MLHQSFENLTDLTVMLWTCRGAGGLSIHTVRNTTSLRGSEKAAVNKSKKLMILSVHPSGRERERGREQHIAWSLEPTASFLEMYSLAVSQPSSLPEECKTTAEGIVTGSNREQTLILDTSFERKRKRASCHLPNCEMMSI